MKKDEQANVLLSLKNLYRLFTVKDYPVVKCRARVPFVTQESLFVNENLIL